MKDTPTPATMSRRAFLRTYGALTAASALGSSLWTEHLLAELSPGTGTMRLKLSDYPALSTIGGSVRLTAGPLPPVIVNRASSTTFYAMSIVCQHQGCYVGAYSSALGYIRCACHGSRYGIDGALMAGPALRGLDMYQAQFDGADSLRVQVPGLAFDVKTISTVSVNAGVRRLALKFPAAAFSEYQVYQLPNLTGAPVVVPFATTPSGAATFTKVKPTATADYTVYVDASGTQAFYSVALVIGEYQ